jgi:hypothetical protein
VNVERWRKKPVVIEASRAILTDCEAIEAWSNGAVTGIGDRINHEGPWICKCFSIKTWEGTMTALEGDWIIRGVKGEFYPCKPDIFEATYEPADAPRSESGSAGAPRATIEALRGLIDAVRTRARIDGPPARAIVDALRNADTALHSPRPKEE